MQIATLPVAWPTYREDTSHGLAWRGYAGSPTIASPGPIGIELLAGEYGHVHLHVWSCTKLILLDTLKIQTIYYLYIRVILLVSYKIIQQTKLTLST